MDYQIRKAQPEDLPRLTEIYACARAFMASTGNPNQWGTTNPPREALEEDISLGRLYVLEGEDRVHGAFMFYKGREGAYDGIYEGSWSRQEDYGVIHRVAGDGSGGIFPAVLAFCREKAGYLRIDTHADNRVMQGVLKKNGFHYCGKVFYESCGERLGFDFFG